MPHLPFPLEVTVLSQDALGDYIRANHFPGKSGLSCRLYYRSLHDTYRVLSGDQEYFYKIYRQDMRSMEEIQSEIDLLNHLRASDIAAVCPVPQNNGRYIGQFQTSLGMRYGVLFESVGVCGFDEMEETDRLNQALGCYVASIHTAFDTYTLHHHRQNLDTHLFIDQSMDAIRRFRTFHDFDIEFLEDVAERTKKKVSLLPAQNPAYGVCHGDLYGGNIRMDANDDPILFDFDFCGKGYRAYDISLYAYQFGLGCDAIKLTKREQRKDQFLSGYHKVRTMTDSEIDSIALFIPFRRIFNIGMLYCSWLSNTWGDAATIRNLDDDILNLKKWLELNPVI